MSVFSDMDQELTSGHDVPNVVQKKLSIEDNELLKRYILRKNAGTYRSLCVSLLCLSPLALSRSLY